MCLWVWFFGFEKLVPTCFFFYKVYLVFLWRRKERKRMKKKKKRAVGVSLWRRKKERKRKKKKKVRMVWLCTDSRSHVCGFNYENAIENWVLEIENISHVFSVSITHHLKIKELSDGNKIQTNFSAMGPTIFELWVMETVNPNSP